MAGRGPRSIVLAGRAWTGGFRHRAGKNNPAGLLIRLLVDGLGGDLGDLAVAYVARRRERDGVANLQGSSQAIL